MNKIFVAILMTTAITLGATSGFAGILKTNAGLKSIEKIQIAKDGTVTIDGKEVLVSLIGAGLREKKVVLFHANVYVAELLSDEAAKFVRTEAEALNSLEQSRTIALRLNFLRTVDGTTIQKSFAEALKVNSVNLESEPIAKFLTAVSSGDEIAKGKSLTIVSQKKADKTETLYYEDGNGKVSSPLTGPEGFSKQIMSIWLGKSTDPEIEVLKQNLIKGL